MCLGCQRSKALENKCDLLATRVDTAPGRETGYVDPTHRQPFAGAVPAGWTRPRPRPRPTGLYPMARVPLLSQVSMGPRSSSRPPSKDVQETRPPPVTRRRRLRPPSNSFSESGARYPHSDERGYPVGRRPVPEKRRQSGSPRLVTEGRSESLPSLRPNPLHLAKQGPLVRHSLSSPTVSTTHGEARSPRGPGDVTCGVGVGT